MSDRDLRARLIRLAHAHPEFRADILPLVTATYEQDVKQDADPKAKDQSKDDYWNGLDPKKPALGDPALPPKTAKLMSRQEALLQKYMETAARSGARAATDWDELPDSVREALRRVKDQETLWMDVNRWFMDNAPAGGLRWAAGEGQSKNDYWDGLEPKKPAIDEPALPPKSAAWENLPPGWTQESVQSFWDSLTGDVKHKVTKCMKQMEGKVDDPGAFCGSLGSAVGYRAASSGQDASLLRKAAIRVAHENPAHRTALLPFLSKKADAEGWEPIFDKLDATFTSWNPNKVTDWNKVYKEFRGLTNDAGAAAHWYSEYRAKRQTRDEAIKALQSEGVRAPKLAASKKA